jgi:hypothetical protein
MAAHTCDRIRGATIASLNGTAGNPLAGSRTIALSPKLAGISQFSALHVLLDCIAVEQRCKFKDRFADESGMMPHHFGRGAQLRMSDQSFALCDPAWRDEAVVKCLLRHSHYGRNFLTLSAK